MAAIGHHTARSMGCRLANSTRASRTYWCSRLCFDVIDIAKHMFAEPDFSMEIISISSSECPSRRRWVFGGRLAVAPVTVKQLTILYKINRHAAVINIWTQCPLSKETSNSQAITNIFVTDWNGMNTTWGLSIALITVTIPVRGRHNREKRTAKLTRLTSHVVCCQSCWNINFTRLPAR